ncbi:hypothetical protein [Streptomyces hebeiensis]|uniref:hypothetical protein n=1 Tax=Streptomyces hebeiensis TaxID=229486 RepID=UPI0031D77014
MQFEQPGPHAQTVVGQLGRRVERRHARVVAVVRHLFAQRARHVAELAQLVVMDDEVALPAAAAFLNFCQP